MGSPTRLLRALRVAAEPITPDEEAAAESRGLAIEVDLSLPIVRVIALLEQRGTIYGRLRQRRCDNGPEFLADAMTEWALQHGIHLHCIEPGKLNQNTYIERVNKSVRTAVLDAWVFASLDDVRNVSEQWRHAYHTEWSHESLGRVPHSPSSRDQPPPLNRLISNCALDGEIYVTAGDNPERLRSEAALAALCGASPVEASSGLTIRHRLNRGGDRKANNARSTVALVRMRSDPRTRTYAERRRGEGRSRKEIMRCLKRYLVRELFPLIVADIRANPGLCLT